MLGYIDLIIVRENKRFQQEQERLEQERLQKEEQERLERERAERERLERERAERVHQNISYSGSNINSASTSYFGYTA